MAKRKYKPEPLSYYLDAAKKLKKLHLIDYDLRKPLSAAKKAAIRKLRLKHYPALNRAQDHVTRTVSATNAKKFKELGYTVGGKQGRTVHIPLNGYNKIEIGYKLGETVVIRKIVSAAHNNKVVKYTVDFIVKPLHFNNVVEKVEKYFHGKLPQKPKTYLTIRKSERGSKSELLHSFIDLEEKLQSWEASGIKAFGLSVVAILIDDKGHIYAT